ncbi:hypothetical protein ACFFLS_02945 [Flavobacterium procerum]|uniref:Lipoprotein n=1 Tax=Flavobacterium procerum TaxID=1455569 RepID=A0ABV6BKM0_9FLAO
MKTKLYFLFILTLLASCNNEKTIEEILIAHPDEYWTYYNPNSGDFTYYKFNENKFTERYVRDSINNFLKYKPSGHVVEVSQRWSVSKDSILRFNGFVYDVVNYNENTVVLYFKDLNTKEERMVFLTKEKAGSPRQYSDYYYERRITQPEKYKVPNAWWTSK